MSSLQTVNKPLAKQPQDFTDLFSSQFGRPPKTSWRSRRLGTFTDAMYDGQLALNPSYRRLRARALEMQRLNVLVASVEVPSRSADLKNVVRDLQASRHDVTAAITPMGKLGKFQNINLGLADIAIDEFDWLLVVDDDVDLPPGFLDTFLCVAELADLRICQPAHRFRSYASWQVTQRRWNALAHRTRFVECGPITAFHRSVFPFCLPFPETRWAWGIDVLWSDLATRRGVRMGIVDATPIGHLRPISGSYDTTKAIDEYHDLLTQNDVRYDSRKLLETVEVIRRLG